LPPDQSQILYDGPPEGLRQAADVRVRQFIEGRADPRLLEEAEE
jgi:phospholipid/cholesterol/gamma-HCH transport system ATP-binding protein